ncbi:2-succinyl-6-hydroxy-2,4-cyclohexadiene-1-carboxylate synthase [Priestia megaterium]|nr:2-succinyl-6-hydroxy-2,4-cyclohexadiene-1-carboxylate synthase [Priestia megaterium]
MWYIHQGVSYYVEIIGEGEPLLLLHGFTGSSQTWRTLSTRWASHYQVISIDIIGHGKTDSPLEIEPYRIEEMVKILYGLIQHLALQDVNIVGYSMGGRLALSFACTYPDYVKALVLESASPGLKSEQEMLLRKQADNELAETIQKGGIEQFVQYWEDTSLFHTQKKLPPSIQAEIRQERLNQCEVGLANSLRGMGTGAQLSLWKHLHKVNLPVLLITGELDEKFCRIGKEMVNLFPCVHHEVVFQTGHAIHVEQPEIFGKIVSEFLVTT